MASAVVEEVHQNPGQEANPTSEEPTSYLIEFLMKFGDGFFLVCEDCASE
jgi:hypothetical protein